MKFPNIKFHENLTRDSLIVRCRRTDTAKVTVPFRNFMNEPKTRPSKRIWMKVILRII